MWRRAYLMTFSLLLCLAAASTRADFDTDLHELQQNWAIARYQFKDHEQQQRLRALIPTADALVSNHPSNADAYLWAAIVRGSLAESVNGFSVLSTVKEAKTLLEKSWNLIQQQKLRVPMRCSARYTRKCPAGRLHSATIKKRANCCRKV